MILNIVAGLFCCALPSIAGAIVAGLAIGRADHDLPSARKLVAWGWGLLVASVLLGIVIVVVAIAIGAASPSGSDGSTTQTLSSNTQFHDTLSSTTYGRPHG